MPAKTEADLRGLVRDAINENGDSVRGLATRLAKSGVFGKDRESVLRALNKYLSGEAQSITTPRARALAKELAKPRDYFMIDPPPRKKTADELRALRADIAALNSWKEDAEGTLRELEQAVGRLVAQLGGHPPAASDLPSRRAGGA